MTANPPPPIDGSVGAKVRFGYELERALRRPVPDRRYRKDADFATILRYFLPPGWEWLVGTPGQFVPQLLKQSLRALRLNGLEGHPAHLADVDV